MASLKDIRARIDSTKNTQAITKAMKMVSAAKLRKAQQNIVNMRPYANALIKVIADIAVSQRVSHPLLNVRPKVEKVLMIVITSDRGLCGGFNSQINKWVTNYISENTSKYQTLDFLFIGKKGYEFFNKKGINIKETMLRLDKDISYTLAAKVADTLMTHYLDGKYDEIRFVYNEFRSAISQVVVTETILPVDLSKTTFDSEPTSTSFSADLIFEPNPKEIIDELLLKHFGVQVYRCMSESVASEHGARMSAMENASGNAKSMINALTLTYNKLRQEKITTELTEITSGAEALK